MIRRLGANWAAQTAQPDCMVQRDIFLTGGKRKAIGFLLSANVGSYAQFDGMARHVAVVA